MYEYELDKERSGSFSNCTNMDVDKVRLLALMRGVTAALCLVVCVVTIFLLIRKRDLVKTLRESTQARLMGYLLLSTTVYLMVLSTHVEHYWNYDGSGNNTAQREQWQVDLCVAVGMADQYTGSVQLFFIMGVAIYFIYCSQKLLCKQTFNMDNVKKWRKVLETLLVVSSVVVPALYVWVPFRAVPYGETGPWCWISALKRDCSEIKGTFWEQMGIWYIPFGIAAFSSLFAITLFLVGLCLSMSQFKKRKGQKKGEACLLIAFLCTYCLLFLVEIVCHSIADQIKGDHFTVWILYALSTPLSGVTLPIGLLIYTYTGTLREVAKEYCTCHCIRRRSLFIALFRDPSSFTCEASLERSSDFVRLSKGSEDMSVQLPLPNEKTGLINQATN